MRICFSIICQDSEIARLRNTSPCPLLSSLEVARREDLLVVRGPPVWSAGGTEDELVSVVEDDEGVVGMCSCY